MGTVSILNIPRVENSVLVERFQNGDSIAFDEIVDRCQSNVYNLAYRFTRNCEDALDISQEVFVKVFKSLGALKNSSAFDPWLRRVTINACMDYLRQRPNEQLVDDFSFMELRPLSGVRIVMPDGPVETGEIQKIISRAVTQLPKRQQRVFVLRH